MEAERTESREQKEWHFSGRGRKCSCQFFVRLLFLSVRCAAVSGSIDLNELYQDARTSLCPITYTIPAEYRCSFHRFLLIVQGFINHTMGSMSLTVHYSLHAHAMPGSRSLSLSRYFAPISPCDITYKHL